MSAQSPSTLREASAQSRLTHELRTLVRQDQLQGLSAIAFERSTGVSVVVRFAIDAYLKAANDAERRRREHDGAQRLS